MLDLSDPVKFMNSKKVMTNAESLKIGFANGYYPYDEKMPRTEYEKFKGELQAELLKVQKWVRQSGQRIVSLFEGRDAAGKGGTIKRFMEHLNPRAAHVVALEKPTESERGQWYFQRYIQQLPTKGELVFFDRSWYNRPGVELVMGFCTSREYLDFLRQAPSLERMLVNSGLTIVQVLVFGEPLRAVASVPIAETGSAQTVETQPGRHGIPRAVERLHESQGGHVFLHRYGRLALDGDQIR